MANCVTITVTGVPSATTTCNDPTLGITGPEGQEYCVTSTNTEYKCESGLWKNIGKCDGGSGILGDFDLNAWLKENSMLVVGGCAVAAALMLLTSRRGGD